MNKHPDPLTDELLNQNPEARAAYERLRPRYEFVGAVVQARHARGWTQKDLAAAIGTTQSAVARLESGEQDPRMSTIVAVCHALDLPYTIGTPFSKAS